jgi:murein DD-endopeptidase MepM/ murein hydrolase activator NlpD
MKRLQQLILAAVIPLTTVTTAAPPDDTARAVQNFRDNKDHAHEEVLAAGPSAIPGLARILADRKLPSATRFSAANALGEIGTPAAVKPLLAALNDQDFNVRRCAALALGAIGDPAAEQPLKRLATSDPFAYKDPESGKTLYLVRDDARKALELLAQNKQPAAPAETAPTEISNADAPPPPPVKVQIKKLPWPFPGDFAAQNLFNNYQQPTDGYVHAGLDLIQPAGTDVRAVDDGYVAAVATNYPDWTTHHFFIVTPTRGGNEGWCYTHVDPASYTFKVGDQIRQGQSLGKVVDFYVGKGNKGADHLHLHYVRFTRTGDKVDTISLADPLQFFDFDDAAPPVIDDDLHFVRQNSYDEFPPGPDGTPVVRGPVDIIAGISDVPAPDTGCNWGVPVVTLEITGPGYPKPLRKLVLDHRGPIPDPTVTRPLYLPWKARDRFLAGRPPYPVTYFLTVTHTDGNGLIDRRDANQTWDTTKIPDGPYEVTVRAWDLKGNLAKQTAKVRVANRN